MKKDETDREQKKRTQSVFSKIIIPYGTPADGGSWYSLGEKQWGVLDNMIPANLPEVRRQLSLVDGLYETSASEKDIITARKRNCKLAIASIRKLLKKLGGSAILIEEHKALGMEGWIHEVESDTMRFDPEPGGSSLSLPDAISLSDAGERLRVEDESIERDYGKCLTDYYHPYYRRAILRAALNCFENLGFLPEWKDVLEAPATERSENSLKLEKYLGSVGARTRNSLGLRLKILGEILQRERYDHDEGFRAGFKKSYYAKIEEQQFGDSDRLEPSDNKQPGNTAGKFIEKHLKKAVLPIPKEIPKDFIILCEDFRQIPEVDL